MTFPRSFLVLLVAGCAHAQSPTEAPSTAPTTSPPVSAPHAATAYGPAAPTAASATPTSSVAADAGPPPLRSGSPGGTSPFATGPDAKKKPSDCSEAQVIARLREVTDRCHDQAGSVCGKITVASDRKDNRVGATFDLATGGAVGAFSECVSREITSVNWGCVVGSEPVTLDLGCDL